jgi:DNA-binding CsgD family transcriptional regulator
MSIWNHLLYLIGLRPNSDSRTYKISESLHVTLTTLAQHEGRPEHELANDLLAAGLTQYYSSDELWRKWETLSPRERDVSALACLGFTNKQIAGRLHISAETVKTHLRNALTKFNLHSRSELRMMLEHWDFSAWE